MKRISVILVILWMIVIFTLSNANGTLSTKQSNGIVYKIVNLIHYQGDIDNIRIVVRKCAHLTEYFVLGLLTYNACKYNGKNTVLLPIMICLIYAISDELHQFFVSSRTCSILDVTLDFFGSSIAVLLRKK